MYQFRYSGKILSAFVTLILNKGAATTALPGSSRRTAVVVESPRDLNIKSPLFARWCSFTPFMSILTKSLQLTVLSSRRSFICTTATLLLSETSRRDLNEYPICTVAMYLSFIFNFYLCLIHSNVISV